MAEREGDITAQPQTLAQGHQANGSLREEEKCVLFMFPRSSPGAFSVMPFIIPASH